MSTLPLTYPDLVFEEDLDPFAAETTSDFQNLVQDVNHLLEELPGTNPDDPLRGVGIETYLSGTLDNLKNLPKIIESQIGEDDRVNSVVCTVTAQTDSTYLILIVIGVAATVLTLEFSWAQSAGLVLSSVTGG